MKVYHFAKTEEAYRAILQDETLLPGRNIVDPRPLVHLSLKPFNAGAYDLDTMGPDTNKAWIFELEVPDDTHFEWDPAERSFGVTVLYDSEHRLWTASGGRFLNSNNEEVPKNLVPVDVQLGAEEAKKEMAMWNAGVQPQFVVYEGPLPVKVLKCTYIPNVQEWEASGGELKGKELSITTEITPPSRENRKFL